jgi:dihydropteroate synthase
MTSNIKGMLIDFKTPKVMGILNCTPDSFYASSRKQTEKEIAERTIQIYKEGGMIIDIGACSTRPSATLADEAEELKRLKFGLSILFREIPDAIVSVDTFRANIARCAVEEFGVSIINDVVSNISNMEMIRTVAKLKVPYILVHNKYSDSVKEYALQYPMSGIIIDMSAHIRRLRYYGIKDIWVDPGFGFNKTLEDNYGILRLLEDMHLMECPVLIGLSRKTMIREILETTPEESLNGTTALHMVALIKKANILRVHDVREAVETIKLYNHLFPYKEL